MAYHVTVYTQGGCMPCALTKRALAQRGIDYHERPAAEQPLTILSAALALGAEKTAPLVMVHREQELVAAWGGFRPDLIERLLHPAYGLVADAA